MTERDFEIGGRSFKLNKINAFKQFHIVRRIAPILAELMPALKDVAKVSSNLNESEKLDEFAKILSPIMMGLSKLSDADSDMVLYALLGSVEIKQEPTGNWAKVANENMLMMQELELPVLLQIAGRAFAYNLSGFFAGMPSK